MIDLENEIRQKARELKRFRVKPTYVIVDEMTYHEQMQYDQKNFIPSCGTMNMDGDRYMGLKIVVLLHVKDRVVEVK